MSCVSSWAPKGSAQEKTSSWPRIKAGGDVFAYQMALADLEFAQGNVAESTKLLQGLISAASSPEHTLAAQIKLAEMYVS